MSCFFRSLEKLQEFEELEDLQAIEDWLALSEEQRELYFAVDDLYKKTFSISEEERN